MSRESPPLSSLSFTATTTTTTTTTTRAHSTHSNGRWHSTYDAGTYFHQRSSPQRRQHPCLRGSGIMQTASYGFVLLEQVWSRHCLLMLKHIFIVCKLPERRLAITSPSIPIGKTNCSSCSTRE
ncbi:hypothetical protein E2C01_047039 [Portunus trituberculatus]|uniref:Uncharacterized protein n=1 Tax=Portunus trituberculatus TaxID=210409 RepID=A0A5B7G7H6_PORTR|nr:hypothetical protein [Portunus trituberculatus]